MWGLGELQGAGGDRGMPHPLCRQARQQASKLPAPAAVGLRFDVSACCSAGATPGIPPVCLAAPLALAWLQLSLALDLDDLAWALDVAESELLRKAAGKPALLQPTPR